MSEELQMGRFLLSFLGILIVLLRKPLDFAFGFGVSWNSKPSGVDVSETIPGQVLQVTAVVQKSCWACSKIQIFNILLKENHLMNLGELVRPISSSQRPALLLGEKLGGSVPLGRSFGLVL